MPCSRAGAPNVFFTKSRVSVGIEAVGRMPTLFKYSKVIQTERGKETMTSYQPNLFTRSFPGARPVRISGIG